jgi:hypothetical protein
MTKSVEFVTQRGAAIQVTATTYTVVDYNGAVIARGLTAAEAADEILSDDGREWEVRPMEGGGWRIWRRQQNRPWTATLVMSSADTKAEAEAEMFAEVCAARWPHHPEAMTDARYAAMIADLEADEG